MKQKRGSSFLQLLALGGLAVLFYGWAFYPPLGVPMAIASLVFILALAIAWIVGRFRGHG